MGDGKAVFDTDDGDGTFQSTNILTLNNTYRITFDVNITDGVLRFESGAGNNFLVSSSGTYTHEFKADLLAIKFRRNSTPTRGYIDNISVIEITNDTNLPRIDYTNGTGALLLEPQSTNLVTYSEDFSGSSWHINGGTLTANSGISPDGNNNAYKYNTDGSYKIFRQLITLSTSTNYTFSFYAKNVNATDAFYRVHNNSNATDVISATSYISQINNSEWNRVEVNFTTDSTGTQYAVYLMSGNSGGDILFWGAQLEQLPYATSYIPTNGSAVTRNKDQASRGGISNLINSTEGVLYAEIAALDDDLTFRGLSINDGTTTNACRIYYRNSSNRVQFLFNVGGASQVASTFDLNDIKDYNKIAFSYKQNDFKVYVNGVKITEDTSGIVPTSNTFDKLSFDRGDGSENFYGKVRSLAVFNEALTDEELAKITSTTQQEVFYEMRDKMQQIDADYYEFGDYTTRLKKLF